MRSHRLSALAAGALLLTFAAPAAAIPPGGPVERRDGATAAVTARLVAPAGDVAFTGTGFGNGTVVSIKLDDGLVLPTTPAAGADVFQTVTADGAGAISGTLHLADVRAADQAKVAAGVHRLRLLSSAPAHSVHVDFAVKAPSGPPENLGGGSVFAGPAADLPIDFPFAGDPDLAYDDLPRLVAGSAIPYRFSGFDAGQSSVTIKVDDSQTSNLAVTTADGTGAGAGYGTADLAVGTHWLRVLSGVGGGTPRSIRAPFEVVPNDGRDVASSSAAVPGGNVAFAAQGLTRSPVDYVPNPAKGQTLQARLGAATPVTATADAAGAATGLVPIPDGTPAGTYDVVYWVGFAVQNDFPQGVFVRRVTVAGALPAATAALGAASVGTGGTVSYTLKGFAKNAGGGQKVAVSVDGGAALACVDTDVHGDATGAVTLPATVGAGAHTVGFAAGAECGGGAAAPTRAVSAALTVTAPPAPPAPPVLPAIPPKVVKPAIGSGALRVTGTKVTFLVTPGSATVRYAVTLRTRAAVKLTPRSKKRKVVTLAKRALTVRPGGTAQAITLVLTKDAKTLLRHHRSLAVSLRLTPAGGAAISRSLTLRK
jgi:hypothetical protein